MTRSNSRLLLPDLGWQLAEFRESMQRVLVMMALMVGCYLSADFMFGGPLHWFVRHRFVEMPVEARWGFRAEYRQSTCHYWKQTTVGDWEQTIVDVAPGGAFDLAGVKPGYCVAPGYPHKIGLHYWLDMEKQEDERVIFPGVDEAEREGRGLEHAVAGRVVPDRPAGHPGHTAFDFGLPARDSPLRGGTRIDEWDLLEYSAVPVPENPEALTLALEKGLVTDPRLRRFIARLQADPFGELVA
jgi:hypothetical protein